MHQKSKTYKNDLEKHLLVNLHKLLVPLLDIGGLFAAVGVVVCCGSGVILVMLAPLNNLLENRLVHLDAMPHISKQFGETKIRENW